MWHSNKTSHVWTSVFPNVQDTGLDKSAQTGRHQPERQAENRKMKQAHKETPAGDEGDAGSLPADTQCLLKVTFHLELYLLQTFLRINNPPLPSSPVLL